MNYFCWALIYVCVLLSGALGRVQYKDWQCGSDDFSRSSAFNTVVESCPLLTAELNHCCVVHDDCYVRQLGQKRCDDDFCECNERVLNTTDGQGCQLFATLACLAMPLIAVPAYRSSANYVEPEDLSKHLPLRGEVLAANYGTLYSQCPKVNSTLSSCAIIFNQCRYVPEECAAHLCDCIRDAYRWDNDKDCDKATFNICMIAREEAMPPPPACAPPRDTSRFLPSPAVVVLIMAAVGVLVAYILFRHWRKGHSSDSYTDIASE